MTPISRRAMLGATAGLLAATRLDPLYCAEPVTVNKTGDWFSRRQLLIGLQLYTVGDEARRDIDATFARVAQIGYQAIELAGFHGHTVQALRAAADRHGLVINSIHLNISARGDDPGLDGDLPKLASDLRVLGVTDVVVPTFPIPGRFGSPRQGESYRAHLERVAVGLVRDDWQRTAAQLNVLGSKLRAEGLRLGYHNHNPEFAPLGNTCGMDILLAGTSTDLVEFEMDVGWVAAAGVDPIELLRQHGGRFRMMHVKDIRASTKTNFAFQQDPTEVGYGKLPWNQLLPAAFSSGVRLFYVEQEPPFTLDRFAAIGRSLAFLRAYPFTQGP